MKPRRVSPSRRTTKRNISGRKAFVDTDTLFTQNKGSVLRPCLGHATSTVILLFRGCDLRLHDHPAAEASTRAGAVVPAFIWSRAEEGRWGIRGALEAYLD